jgi:hypothetical protein
MRRALCLALLLCLCGGWVRPSAAQEPPASPAHPLELPPERERLLRALLTHPPVLTRETAFIQPRNPHIIPFDGRRGEVITVTVQARSGTIDPRIALYWRDTLLIAANDDHGSSDQALGRSDARLHRVVLPHDGEYHLYISGYSTTEGDVLITWGRAARHAPVETGGDQVIEGRLGADQPTVVHPFHALAGDYVTLTARRIDGAIDPRLTLRDPDGLALFDNDDHGFTDADLDFFDARIASHPIARSGVYAAVVESRRGGEGAYSLTISIRRDRRLLDPAYPFDPNAP